MKNEFIYNILQSQDLYQLAAALNKFMDLLKSEKNPSVWTKQLYQELEQRVNACVNFLLATILSIPVQKVSDGFCFSIGNIPHIKKIFKG